MVELDWDNVPKDLCPVCKTDKYLTPSLQFKINPECYHKICDSCVERIFSLGPSPCPYPNCGKILRKNKFKSQVFEDLMVERECDIRKRVMTIYNKKEEDFEDLQKYNEYLEEVEEIIYKLMNNEDVVEVEKKLKEYSSLNKQTIDFNNTRKDQEYEKFLKLQNIDKQYKIEKNKLKKDLASEEEHLKQLTKMRVIDEMQQSDSEGPEAVIQKAKEEMQRKAQDYKEQLENLEKKYEKQREMVLSNQVFNKSEEVKEVVIPFTPFNGDRLLSLPYNDSKVGMLNDPVFLNMTKKVEFTASGYKIEDYFQRSLNEAFMGFNIFVEEEKVL